MAHTHVILDGLGDPQLGQSLSAAWAKAGFYNTVDPAGQSATLATHEDDALSESQMEDAATIARVHGLELRDRAGSTYESVNELPALYKRLNIEYRTRFASALVFGLPALVLHYLAPVLVGAHELPRGFLYPWLIELLLVGWMCMAAAYPMLWQGALSFRYLRATPDLLTCVVIVPAFCVTLAAWVSLFAADQPLADESLLHAVTYAVMLAVLQRRWVYRAVDHLAGRANLMVQHQSRIVRLWLVLCVVVWLLSSLKLALAAALLMPPMIGHGAINRTSPGFSMLLPVFAFAALMLLGPRALGLPVENMQIEIAAGFQLIMTCAMALGWRKIGRGQ